MSETRRFSRTLGGHVPRVSVPLATPHQRTGQQQSTVPVNSSFGSELNGCIGGSDELESRKGGHAGTRACSRERAWEVGVPVFRGSEKKVGGFEWFRGRCVCCVVGFCIVGDLPFFFCVLFCSRVMRARVPWTRTEWRAGDATRVLNSYALVHYSQPSLAKSGHRSIHLEMEDAQGRTAKRDSERREGVHVPRGALNL
ncbi:hypothetical protein BDW22DRAFT_441115 [Trametopsis cervina]|nr:hypothetical protein BDW22DRAFT_441115 [Trametopsis cervina]